MCASPADSQQRRCKDRKKGAPSQTFDFDTVRDEETKFVDLERPRTLTRVKGKGGKVIKLKAMYYYEQCDTDEDDNVVISKLDSDQRSSFFSRRTKKLRDESDTRKRLNQDDESSAEREIADTVQIVQNGVHTTRKRKSREDDHSPYSINRAVLPSSSEETNERHRKVRYPSSNGSSSGDDERHRDRQSRTGRIKKMKHSDPESDAGDIPKQNETQNCNHKRKKNRLESCSLPLLEEESDTVERENNTRDKRKAPAHFHKKHVYITVTVSLLLLVGIGIGLLVPQLINPDPPRSTEAETQRPALFMPRMLKMSRKEENYTNAPRALIFLGGERAGYMTDIVEVSPFSSSTSCGLPPLPEKLRWGTAGFVSGSLLVCGGETELGNPSRSCWLLETKKGKWTSLPKMTSPRSQSSGTVSKDGSLLHIIGGRSNFKELGYALPSSQSISIHIQMPEQEITRDSKRLTSCFSSSVTLSSGDVVLTGGKTEQRGAFLLSGQSLNVLTKLPSMQNPRYGHASCVFASGQTEKVIVAGGWNQLDKVQASVELFDIKENTWTELKNMPSPRVYFSLQATESQIRAVGGYYLESEEEKVYPGPASLQIRNDIIARSWNEEGEENEANRQRTGFMTAEVPWPWIDCNN